ncbi:bidirectional sugar transporter SWEET16 [Oryza glaberrima]|uniref:Bidirectional sugar transporter SWEET n=2 Tax=Oryza TaxID=4527 RepID=A0A0D3FIB1_9ORYZ|nr:bidirectional sugar transporter SWEET16 [Oryza glaberrima]
MADPSFFVGIVGNVISILVFASPIATFRRIVRSKSTEEFRWLPYVTTLLSTSLWTFYGLLKPRGLLIVTVNGAGAALEAIYVTLYLAYAPKETKAKMVKVVLAVNVGALAAVVAVALVALHGGVRLFVVGVLCAALTIGMYAAPMAAMRTVVKTRSVEYMPFSLSFFLFLNGGVWSVYSLLVKDYFIGIPNAIGFALGTAQLALYMAYRRTKKPAGKGGDDDEDDEEAQGVARLMGHQVEMAQQRRDQQLRKGLSLSLPKPAAPLHGGLDRIIKSFSTTPVELHSILHQHHGGHNHHHRFDTVPDDDDEAAAAVAAGGTTPATTAGPGDRH